MKIFMLCNVEIPLVAQAEGREGCVFGGWLDDVSRFLSQDNELTICYMNDKNTYIVDKKNIYAGFIESEFESVFLKLINANEYDLFHIWGTEYDHSRICVSILEKKQMLNRCVASIQGLVSFYAKHYAEGIPPKYLRRRSVKELIRGNEIVNGINDFVARGTGERELLSKVKHVIGRTSWDKACIESININAVYHKCNENLRDCFYDDSMIWDNEKVKQHSIFVSQCSYPVKGFHYLLEAMPLILKKYPDTRIVTTGDDFISERKLFQNAYRRYLMDLIESNDLKNKIIFKGLLSAEQMKAEYLLANVFVCSSTIENSPNSVGEAMILGCPVVASCVGGTMDMLKMNEEGYLYQTSSPEMLAYYVCKVFEDEEKTAVLSANARKRAKLTHDRSVNNNMLLSIYRLILDN